MKKKYIRPEVDFSLIEEDDLLLADTHIVIGGDDYEGNEMLSLTLDDEEEDPFPFTETE